MLQEWLSLVVLSGATVACQAQPKSTFQELGWTLVAADVAGSVRLSSSVVRLSGNLDELRRSRGISVEQLEPEVQLETSMDLQIRDRFLAKGRYRLGLDVGRRGASLSLVPVTPPGQEVHLGSAFGMEVHEDREATGAPRFRLTRSAPWLHAANLELAGDGVLLRLPLVAMPELVAARRPTEAAVALLRQAEQFTLVALRPEPRPDETGARLQPHFHGFEILGEGRVRRPEVQAAVVDALLQGVQRSDGALASCFVPRHGIRAYHQGRFVDLVICHECLQVRVHAGQDAPHDTVPTADASATLTPLFEREEMSIAPRK